MAFPFTWPLSKGWVTFSNLCLYTCATLFLFLPFPHVLIFLFGFWKRLEELIENPKELIRLYLVGFLSKMFGRLHKLEENDKINPQCKEGRGCRSRIGIIDLTLLEVAHLGEAVFYGRSDSECRRHASPTYKSRAAGVRERALTSTLKWLWCFYGHMAFY